MAKNKQESKDKKKQTKWLRIHGLVYSACMAAVLFIGTSFSWFGLFIVLVAGFTHFIIDLLKTKLCIKTSTCTKYDNCRVTPKTRLQHINFKSCILCKIHKKEFLIDQLLHLLIIVVLWRIWGEVLTIQNNVVNGFIMGFVRAFGELPESFMLIILGLLCILKPIGVLIEKGDIWDFSKGKGEQNLIDESVKQGIPQKPYVSIPDQDSNVSPNENQKGAGKMIGYLERIIVFFLLYNAQFAAIAFVLTAKSAARFPEIVKSKNASSLAEFYIIGTLLSMTSVFIITFLLGLIG